MIEQLHAPGVEQGECIAIDFAALLFRQYVLQRHEWFTHEFTAPSIANDLVNTVGAEHGGEIVNHRLRREAGPDFANTVKHDDAIRVAVRDRHCHAVVTAATGWINE